MRSLETEIKGKVIKSPTIRKYTSSDRVKLHKRVEQLLDAGGQMDDIYETLCREGFKNPDGGPLSQGTYRNQFYRVREPWAAKGGAKAVTQAKVASNGAPASVFKAILFNDAIPPEAKIDTLKILVNTLGL